MQDKDIDGVIAHLKEHIDHWCVTDLPLPRAAAAADIEQKLKTAYGAKSDVVNAEHSVRTFASPAEAFANALSRAGENDRIAVFGSFLTVAGVMEFRHAEHH
jgi:dihydrofolate synthase/folylpolyglutamate synthase